MMKKFHGRSANILKTEYVEIVFISEIELKMILLSQDY